MNRDQTEIVLPEPFVWRSVNKSEWPATGYSRHICKKGHHTSLCGTTALPATVWRAPRGEKPDCPACVRALSKISPRHDESSA